MINFEECNECRKKQGSPVLCQQCLMLRSLVSEHNELMSSIQYKAIEYKAIEHVARTARPDYVAILPHED